MGVTRDFKLIVLILSAFMLLLCASIYKDKLILLSIVVSGIIVLIFFINKPVRLIYAQIIYNFIVKFAVWNFGIPSYANYFTDVLTALIVIAAVRELFIENKKANIALPMAIVFTFIMVTVIGFIINGQSIFLYIWGFRNNFRFYGFFFGCVLLLKKKDIDIIFKILIVFSFINLLFCTVQFFIYGISEDDLGGIFGTTVGVNSYLNIFICMVTTIVLVQFLRKKASALLVFFIVGSSIFIAAIGELKVFFIELIIIVAGIVLFSRPTKKTFLIVASCIIGVLVGVEIFYRMFPYWNNFFTLEKIISSSQTYSTKTDLGRFTAVPTITNLFLSGNTSNFFFGLGLGSAETSQFQMFSSAFYQEYGKILHYTWFSDAFILIENGWAGLICFMSFFISIIISANGIKKKNGNYADYCIIAQVFAVLCCMLAIYSSVTRTEAGYLIYFMLSLPYIVCRGEKNTEAEVH